MEKLNVYRDFEGEYIVASSEEEALSILINELGLDESELISFEKLDNDHKISIHFCDEEEINGNKFLGSYKKTCLEWVELHGKGILCSLNA